MTRDSLADRAQPQALLDTSGDEEVEMTLPGHSESLRLARLLMVLSSLAPLFVLWAIRGNSLIPDIWFIPACLLLATVPTGILLLRIKTAIRNRDRRELAIGGVEDHRAHLLTYLFAVLLPFYAADVSTWRDLAAMLGALAFIIFVFWRLNLHYLNLLFAIRGYHVFTVSPPEGVEVVDLSKRVLISRRPWLPRTALPVYRLSDTVFIEL